MKLADRVQETTSTTGTGDVTLAGAVAGYIGFGEIPGIVDGDEVPYVIWLGSEFEGGIGKWNSSGDTLTRSRVFFSSNSNNPVSFSSGDKKVWLDRLSYFDFAFPGLYHALSMGQFTP